MAKRPKRTEKSPSKPARRPAKGRRSICFVTSNFSGEEPLRGRGTRYRCFNIAEALHNAGHIVAVYPHDAFLEAPNPDFDIYAFHRPTVADERLRTVVTALKKLQKTVLADIDRYIFGEDKAEDETQSKARADQVRALRLFEFVTTASPTLADLTNEHHGVAQVHVLANSVPQSLLSLIDTHHTNLRPRPERSIGYVHRPDSRSEDFQIIYDVLHKIVWEDPEARLTVFGPCDFSGPLSQHPRVTHKPRIDQSELPFSLAECVCAVAPLGDSQRARCTSRSGYLEASLAGCKVVASPTPDLEGFSAPNLTLANTQEDWYSKITDALDAGHTPRAARSALAHVRKNDNSHARISGLLAFLDGH